MALTEGEWSFVVLIGAILLFSVISNIFVVLVVLRDKKMKNVTNIFICNLAISDILLSGFVLPQNLHDLSHEHNFHEGILSCKFVNGFPVFIISSSIYTLVCISFERKKAIVDSTGSQITVKMCKRIIPFIWIFAAITATPTIIEFDVQNVEGNSNTTYMSCGSHMSRMYSLVNGITILFLSYIIPLILICFNYYKLVRMVLTKGKGVIDLSKNRTEAEQGSIDRSSSFAMYNSSSLVSKKSILFRKRMKITKMLIIIAVVFAISWLPYFVSQTIAKARRQDNSEDASSPINLLKIFLSSFSTGYNVILYVVFNNNFRNGFRKLLCRKCQYNQVGIKINILPETDVAKQQNINTLEDISNNTDTTRRQKQTGR